MLIVSCFTSLLLLLFLILVVLVNAEVAFTLASASLIRLLLAPLLLPTFLITIARRTYAFTLATIDTHWAFTAVLLIIIIQLLWVGLAVIRL